MASRLTWEGLLHPKRRTSDTSTRRTRWRYFIRNRPREFGWGCRPKPKESDKDWEAMPLGKTGAEIYTFDNDTTFE